MLNYYRILDVPQSASMNDIKRAYRTKVLRWHPDKNPDNRKEAEQKFKEIVEAYKVLSDKSTRDHYDENKKDTFKESKKPKHEKTLSVFVQDGIKIFFTGQRSSSDFSVSFFSAPKRFHHFSIMTAFINGKKITTKRHLENESKYLEVEEDGKTVSIHVNGIPVYDREFNGPSGSLHWNCRVDKGRFRPDRWRFWTCERLRWAEEWRRWANKWRDWAEECRDWAEGRQSTNIRGNAKHYQANAKEHPKASPDHFRSDKYCPKSGGKLSGFSMPGEEKGHSKEGNSKINKGPTRPDEEHPNLSKGYFMFPKPGEKTSEMDDGHPRSSKGQHKPEEGNLSPNVGINRLREGPSRQDEGHHRIKKGKPKPDDAQARPGKVPLGLQKSDLKCSASKNSEPMDNEIPKQHISECNSQAEISELHIEKEEPRFEENNFYAIKCETLEKKAPECEKLGMEEHKGASTLVSELVSKAELHCQIKKNFAGHKVASETFSTIGLPMKRREAQIWARKLYSKRNKPQTRMKRRNKPQAGKYRIPDGHSRQELDEKVFSENSQMTPDGKMSPADSKCDPPNSKKGPLPPLQKGDTLPQTRKRFLRRRVHHPLSETQHEKLHSVSETNQLLNTHGQQQRKLKKLPQSSEQLPGIEGQKVGKNQHPDVNR